MSDHTFRAAGGAIYLRGRGIYLWWRRIFLCRRVRQRACGRDKAEDEQSGHGFPITQGRRFQDERVRARLGEERRRAALDQWGVDQCRRSQWPPRYSHCARKSRLVQEKMTGNVVVSLMCEATCDKSGGKYFGRWKRWGRPRPGVAAA